MSDWTDQYEYMDEDNVTHALETITDIEIVHSTDKALLVRRGNEISWFPKSVIWNDFPDRFQYEGWFEPNWQTPQDAALETKSMNSIEGDFE